MLMRKHVYFFMHIAAATSRQVFVTLLRVKYVDVQIEGRGNGIKTNTVNLVDISKALERPPDCESPAARITALLGHMSPEAVCAVPASNGAPDPRVSSRRCVLILPTLCADVLKFFGCELGAQTKYDKTSGTCIVNGGACNPAHL